MPSFVVSVCIHTHPPPSTHCVGHVQKYAELLDKLLVKNDQLLKCIVTHTFHRDHEDIEGVLRHVLVWVCQVVRNVSKACTGFVWAKIIVMNEGQLVMHKQVVRGSAYLSRPICVQSMFSKCRQHGESVDVFTLGSTHIHGL